MMDRSTQRSGAKDPDGGGIHLESPGGRKGKELSASLACDLRNSVRDISRRESAQVLGAHHMPDSGEHFTENFRRAGGSPVS